MTADVLAHSGLRIVPRSPRAIRVELFWHVLDNRVEHHAVTADFCERGVCFEFSQDVLVGMVAVEEDENLLELGRYLVNLPND